VPISRSKLGGLLALSWAMAQALACAQVFTNTSPGAEVALGRQVAAEIERIVGVSSDPALRQRVSRVGSRVAQQLESKLYTYEFRVLRSEQINALALPGGIIFVYEGLLGHIPTDDALAFIIGHEITHASHRHWATTIKKTEGLNILLSVVGAATGTWGDLATTLAKVLIDSAYSQEMEEDADATGLELMWRAHFDPQGGIQAMEMIRQLTAQPKAPRFLRSHPPVDSRIAHLTKIATELAGKERPALNPMEPAPTSEDLLAAIGDLTGIDPVVNAWYPLSAGNEWTYEVAQGAGPRTTYRLRVISALPAQSGAVYRVEWTSGKAKPVIRQVTTTATACWLRPRPTEANSPWMLDFTLPPLPEEPVIDGQWTYSGVGAEQISVPCGRFEASIICKRGGDPVCTYRLWFAQNVGLLKRLWEEKNISETLTRYTIIPPPGAPASAPAAPTP
jgi:Zn-dependent protease with chaperone function